MLLSIPLHVTNVHEFPDNVHHKVIIFYTTVFFGCLGFDPFIDHVRLKLL
jgi:hypothetical protein